MKSTLSMALIFGLATTIAGVNQVGAAVGGLEAEASWQVPSREAVRGDLMTWLKSQKVDAAVLRKVEELWGDDLIDTDGMDTLERAAVTVALVEPRAVPLVKMCRQGDVPNAIEAIAWLREASVSPIVANNLRLLLSRSLAQHNYFDEALLQLEGLETEDVIDPASLLFYRSVVTYRLVQKKECVKAMDRLLENKEAIPRRYATLASLMRADLAPLKEGSLDDISRHMRDVERHLDLGRADKQVTMKEDGVITKLDKLIEEEEAKQDAGGAGGAGGIQSSSPAPDSMPLGGHGAGRVTSRNIGNSSDWGELPPKVREEAMQDIGRDFPAHYREVIEAYYRELAKKK